MGWMLRAADGRGVIVAGGRWGSSAGAAPGHGPISVVALVRIGRC